MPHTPLFSPFTQGFRAFLLHRKHAESQRKAPAPLSSFLEHLAIPKNTKHLQAGICHILIYLEKSQCSSQKKAITTNR
jgi:hypothetical protein